jgi:CRAL/TRIO domain
MELTNETAPTRTASTIEEAEQQPSGESVTEMTNNKVVGEGNEEGDGEPTQTISLWTKTLETKQKMLETLSSMMTAAHVGTNSKRSGDVLRETVEDAVASLLEMVEAQEGGKWAFPHTPLADFGATELDLLAAFCKWARQENDNDDKTTTDETTSSDSTTTTTTTKRINVTKAFGRLQSYVNWMDAQAHKKGNDDTPGIFDEPITASSFVGEAGVAARLGMKITHDATGRLVWWIDMDAMDAEALHNHTIPMYQVVRFVVWTTHLILLDTQAQDNGMVIIENLSREGLYKSMTMFPLNVMNSMDRLTMGVLPIKVKGVVVLQTADWMRFILNRLVKPFLSQKMRQRVQMVGKNDNSPRQDEAQAVVSELLGGCKYILTEGCCGLEGTLTEEIIFGTYLG